MPFRFAPVGSGATLKGLFIESNLVGGPKETLRWLGTVKNGYLALLGRRGEPIPVNGFHNAFPILAIGDDHVPTAAVTQAPAEVAITFGLERDLQTGLRQNIAQLEPGLTIQDGGNERSTDAGKIDITARDRAGRTVVIKLKAGTAMPEALTQLLAYVAAIGNDLKLDDPQRRVFWEMFRNGFLHQGMVKSGKTQWVVSDRFGSMPEFRTLNGTQCVCVDPWKFARRVLGAFTDDPRLVSASESFPLASVFEFRGDAFVPEV